MEHQPLKLEPLRHEKARLATFKKRKGSLMKKALEFTTLCDVEGCIILYGPKHRNLPDKPEIWVSEKGKLISIIRKYKKTVNTAEHVEQRTALSSSKFKENKTRQVEDDAPEPRKKKSVGNYPTWDERMDGFTEDQLKMTLAVMDNKLKLVNKKLKGIKGSPHVLKKAQSRKLDHGYCRSYLVADIHKKHDANPLNLELAINLQTDNDQACRKLPSYASPMKSQCGGESGSSTSYTPVQGPVYRNHRPGYDHRFISPASSGGSEESGYGAKKSTEVLQDQSGEEE